MLTDTHSDFKAVSPSFDQVRAPSGYIEGTAGLQGQLALLPIG